MEHPNKVHSSRAAYLYLFSIPGHTSPIPTVTRHYGDTLPLCSSEATSSPESAKEQPGSPIPHIRPTSRYTAAQELQAPLLATLWETLYPQPYYYEIVRGGSEPVPIAPSPHTIPTRPTAVSSTREPALAALCIALYTQQAVQHEATQVVTHCDY